MLTHLRPALVMLLMFTALTGIAYPLAIAGSLQIVAPSAANGSLVVRNGAIVGSELIGQSFTSVRYFWGRLSATAPVPYNAAASGGSKFDNLNTLLAGRDLAAYDWVLVLDDDVALPPSFLDRFLAAAEDAGLVLAQPAHRRLSHAAWDVTRRAPRSTARETTFVEIGPVTAFAREAAAELLPFPADAGMGWGLDAHWAAVARERDWRIGIVDATPIGHTLRPAAATYPREEAAAAAQAFLAGRAYVRRDEVRTLAVHR